MIANACLSNGFDTKAHARIGHKASAVSGGYLEYPRRS